MSQKQNKRNVPVSSTTSNLGVARLLQKEIERVRELIAGRHSKSALQLAKDLYKRSATTESETLLTDAYKARIDDLLRLGMTVEAKTLLGIVQQRFPQALPRFTEIGREICAQDGKLEEVVAPLADRELPAEERDRVETVIRQRIWDLRALGTVSSLPSEHSLRKAASALAAAFQAVTTGPVNDAVLELPEVSRRSPLASWKSLIWAIACYHRGEDEECGRWLQTIPIDSVPARILPTFTVMLKSKPGAKTEFKSSLAAQKLIAEAGDHGAALRSALIELEDALQTKKMKRILDAAQTAMAATNHCGAVTRERLRQHIEVRSEMEHIPRASIYAALGGAPRRDAYYFRLLAATLEDQRNMDSYAEAVVVWSEFRREAIKERWFAPGGLEDGILSLHMGELIERVPAEIIEDLKEEMTFYRSAGKGNKEEQIPSPSALYERACKADPHPEAFQAWLNWASKQGHWQVADHVAEQWRMSRPADIQPLLYLMESAEKRDAFKKSLKYLEEAENLDRLSPEVRRARLRLLLSGALRHLQQRKAHLALVGIEQIETVPEVRPGEIATLAAALRWCAAMIGQEKAVQDEQETKLRKSMGSVAAHLLMASVAEEAEICSLHPLKIAKIPAAELLGGVARSCVLGEWADLAIALPSDWNKQLIAALNLPNCPLDAAQMLVMGEAALDRHSAELSYAVSTAGLATGGANAEFLFLRARSLPLQTSFRREGCITASLELARRERNTGLAGRILDHLNGKKENDRRRWKFGSGMGDDPRIASLAVSQELLGKILEEEQKLDQFPGCDIDQEPQYAEELGDSFCDCPKCRARRAGQGEDGEDIDDEDDFDDGDDFDEEEEAFDGAPPRSLKQMAKRLEQMLSSLPPPLAQAMAQQLKKAMAGGESPLDAIGRIMGSALPKPGSPASSPFKKKEKPVKAPPPEQGRLF
jgi:hypothetical protein